MEDVLALSEASRQRADLDSAFLAAVVNVQYDALLSAIDLLKSHTEMPSVPRRRG